MSNWQNALDNALQAAARGFGVFPLSRNKVPAIPSPHDKGHSCAGLRACGAFGHGVGDASTCPDIIRAGFEQARHAAGYGIACGAGPLPLIGVDLDRKNGVDGCATLNQLATEHGFTVPRTVTVCTPSGGFHLWFTGPAGAHIPNSAGRLGPGIDVRGTRGYLVGPGSRGKTGEYTIHPSASEPTVYPIPEQLLQLLTPPARTVFRQPHRPSSPDHGGRVLDGLVRVVTTAAEGTRNDRLFWAAAKAWAHVRDGHLAARDVEAALVSAAVGVGLGEGEARRTVASAQKGAGA
ncbi:bifunctional DNA primase/polymerase [Streptomyces wuyuanensis]|uniref:Bifunctional DNA primase/polymerase, N-terminal n=1 Tax=Streptomyces wuyuanensis TaxID=1196353 RepID=A0A1H0EGR4_9ACTN|nr:bifunctional DNA primase/polymerase [Streptomyces wuyuanensis]SDN81520.1 Bifunctional DNA primase/polymerase, N-terminal [Streptomyces wuyuanensis]